MLRLQDYHVTPFQKPRNPSGFGIPKRYSVQLRFAKASA